MSQNTVSASTTAHLPYSLMAANGLSWKESFLATWQILRLFVNTLIADDNYSLLHTGNLTQHIQMHLSEKQKYFSEFFCAFFKSTLNFEYSKKKVILITYVFLDLWTPKNVIR